MPQDELGHVLRHGLCQRERAEAVKDAKQCGVARLLAQVLEQVLRVIDQRHAQRPAVGLTEQLIADAVALRALVLHDPAAAFHRRQETLHRALGDAGTHAQLANPDLAAVCKQRFNQRHDVVS